MTETMDQEKLFRRDDVTFPEQICLLYTSDLSHALIPNKQRKKQCEKMRNLSQENWK